MRNLHLILAMLSIGLLAHPLQAGVALQVTPSSDFNGNGTVDFLDFNSSASSDRSKAMKRMNAGSTWTAKAR